MPDPRFHDVVTDLRLSEIAERAGLTPPAGADPNRIFTGLGGLAEAGQDTISFLANTKYADQLPTTSAGAVLVTEQDAKKVPSHTIAWITPKPYLDFSKVSRVFHPDPERIAQIHPMAFVDPSATLGEGVRIDPGAVVHENVLLGDGVWLASNAVVDRGCTVGEGTRIEPNAYIGYADIGRRCRIGAGATIGTRGFGVAMDGAGHLELPQVGAVKIGDDVELGANCSVDRGMGPDTVIGDGTKIDNLVQIGHNVRIGKHCVLAGQCGIAGSTVLEDFVVFAGNVISAGHITIATGTQVAGGSGLMRNTEPGAKLGGYPALPFKQWMRQHAVLKKMVSGEKRKGKDEG